MNLKLFGLLLMLAASPHAGAGAVIVAANSSAGGLDAQQVKRLFLGREAAIGNDSVTVIYQKAGAVKTDFETKILNKTGAELASYWAKLIFTGRAKAPQEVSGDDKVKAAVLATPGAIGYINDAAIDGTVKVLFKF